MTATESRQSGALYVFEGPDGIGKSSLAQALTSGLVKAGVESQYLAFPGREDGTLGHLVYQLHHDSRSFGVESIHPASLQTLHIAAHIDAINKRILPLLQTGCSVVLDRFWWSTWAYGLASGVDRTSLKLMLNLEHAEWRSIMPSIAFLLDRDTPFRTEYPLERWLRVRQAYTQLADDQSSRHKVVKIANVGTIEDAISQVLQVVREHQDEFGVSGKKWPRRRKAEIRARDCAPTQAERSPLIFSTISPARPTKVYDTLWYFAAERQNIFFRRLHGASPPWTNDRVLQQYKFTNAYRASDRVSQYLIRNVIYSGDQSVDEVFFRTLLFKLFNRISTWELLTEQFGGVSYRHYDFARYDAVLTGSLSSGIPIFSNAYIMPSGAGHLRQGRKHRACLALLEQMMATDAPARIRDSTSMLAVFEFLRTFPMIGEFLAYQLAIDLNYGPITNFPETEFVAPGPGARDGLSKCFSSFGGLNESEVIRTVTERQEQEFERLGIAFRALWGRPLQLIDVQNLFCEVSKYARVAHPEVDGIAGRTRIKQRFEPTSSLVKPWYPPKWGLNDSIAAELKGAG